MLINVSCSWTIFSGDNNMTGFWTRNARFVPVHQNHPMKTLYILYILFWLTVFRGENIDSTQKITVRFAFVLHKKKQKKQKQNTNKQQKTTKTTTCNQNPVSNKYFILIGQFLSSSSKFVLERKIIDRKVTCWINNM